MFREFYKILLLVLTAFSFTYAQSGRVAGNVTDKQTGEALIGANVIIIGTSYGAAADINGDYIINQTPSGTYDVRASYIGYRDFVVRGITIVSGLTTEINFQLNSSDITTEEIVVESKKPLIQKSATNAIRITGAEDIDALPMRNISDIVALQPGVVKLNGLTYIRGSRADETGYLVEGADVKDILNRDGGSLVSVTPDALQEITTQAGGYTAEFGNANAGIVSQELKTGSDKYHFSIRSETDNFGNLSSADKFMGTYSYGYSDNVVTFGGPLFTKKLKIFISGENRFMRDRTPQFFDGNPAAFSDGALLDTTQVFDTGALSGIKDESQILAWNSGALQGRSSNRYTVNGTLLYDSNPLFIRLAGAFTRDDREMGDRFIRNIYNLGRVPQDDQSSLLLNLKTTYLFSDKAFLVGNVNFYNLDGKRYDPLYEDNYLLYGDSLAASANGYDSFRGYSTAPQNYDFYGFPFERPGDFARGGFYFKDHNSYLGGSLAFNAQVKKHSFKVGGSYQRWSVRHFQLNLPDNYLTTVRSSPDLVATQDGFKSLVGSQLFRRMDNYGYDVFGNETDAEPFRGRNPVFASAYVLDRLEVKDLILNVGLRFDYIDMDTWALINPKLPVIDETTNLVPQSEIKDGRTFSFVSPRVGFSFPVTDKTVFHMQYGKFVQAPSLDVAFRGLYTVSSQLKSGNLQINPVAYDPEPIRTTQYEIGFTQQFTDFAAMDITAFYKDIKGQIQYQNIKTEPGAQVSKYPAFVNQDFATTRGLELSLKIRRVNRVRAQLDYTFSNSDGTNTFTNSGLGANEANSQSPTVLSPLTFNFQHSGSMMLDYRFAKDDGGPILERLGFNFLFTFNSGHPFTFAQVGGLGQNSAWTGGLIPSDDSRLRRPIGPVNSSDTPWQYNLDLRIDKTVSIFKFDVNFYVYARNVFNTRTVTNVYQKTGNPYDDGFLQSVTGQNIISQARYTERFADLYRAANLGNRQAAFANYAYDLFGTPRQLRAGIQITF